MPEVLASGGAGRPAFSFSLTATRPILALLHPQGGLGGAELARGGVANVHDESIVALLGLERQLVRQGRRGRRVLGEREARHRTGDVARVAAVVDGTDVD